MKCAINDEILEDIKKLTPAQMAAKYNISTSSAYNKKKQLIEAEG